MQRTRARDSIRHILTTLALALCVLMVPVSAASAHDSIAGSNPKDGQTLKMVPDTVSLAFTSPPIALGSEVLVTDAEGKNWAEGKVEIIDNTVKQRVSGDAPIGKYKVSWRVVSEDSHPIEGTFEFTVAGASKEAREASPVPAEPTTATIEPTAPTSEANATEPVDPAIEKASETSPTTMAVATVAGLIAMVAIIAVIARRRISKVGSRRR